MKITFCKYCLTLIQQNVILFVSDQTTQKNFTHEKLLAAQHKRIKHIVFER